ncbi:MAG: molybdopterin-containing oxidoreductase family protein [Salibacteraceae bacterium]
MAKQQKHHTFCRICESLCGLEVTTENGNVVDIKPNKSHLATEGFSCVKGLKQHEMFYSKDRLTHPLKKMPDGSHQPISWEQAYKEIGEKVKHIRKNNAPNSIGMYVGTAAGFSVLHPVFAQGFMDAVGSKSMYASATQDCSNKFAVARHLYGFPFTQPFPDLENTKCLIIVGANPVISKWSFLQVANPSKKLKELTGRGAKLYFIDPRKTESASIAGKHLFIRPGTDVFFYLSFLNELIRTNGIDKSQIENHTTGFEEIKELCQKWTPEYTQSVTGIKSDDLKEIVSSYANANGAALYCSTGVNMGGNGSLAFWIQEIINTVSGNLDKKGGTLVSTGVIDFVKFGVKNGLLMRNDRSRIGDIGSVNDAFSGGVLADEILTPGEGQLKAMFITGGNPLITMANSERLKAAFESLDLLVTLDIYNNETGSVADYVLPCTDPLQRPDLPFIFPLMLGLQQKPYIQATRAVVPIQGEQRDEGTIYYNIAEAAGVPLFGSKVGHSFFKLLKWVYTKRNPGKYSGMPQEFILNLLLLVSGQKNFKSLLRFKNGKAMKKHKSSSFLEKRVHTPSKKVELAPAVLIESAKELDTIFEKEKEESDKFKLITKRAVTTHNSWTHNAKRMVAKGRDRNYLYMHPSDMEKKALLEGDLVDVTSKTNTVRIAVKALDTLMPLSVAMPHGWGHQHAKGLSVANKTKGVNVNILAADGPENVDKVSGMVHLTGIPVDIQKTNEAQAHTWSGK